MKDLAALVAEHPFFENLAPEHLALVAGCAQLAVYEKNAYLFKYGDDAAYFFLIRYGRVALELTGPGADSFRFQTAGAGEVLGWSWLFPPHQSQFDARVIEDARVIRFDGKCLRGKCDCDPVLGYDLMKRFAQVMVRRFADTRLQLIDVYGKHGR